MITIKRPTLLVDEERARNNIRRIAEKAAASQVALRPHFKTHQSATIGEWYRETGVEKITVSSVDMALYFAENGWTDITIAFPYNPLAIEDINYLASKIKLNILIESEEALDHLQAHIQDSIGYFVKIDTGGRRTGLLALDIPIIEKLVQRSSSKTVFQGLYAHAAHTYGARSTKKVQEFHQNAMDTLQRIQSELDQEFFIAYGDTPSASILSSFEGINELCAGNYVFYDLMQENIGSCQMEDIAVVMACPVVSIQTRRDEAVIHGGAAHFSKDSIRRANDDTYFGQIVRFTDSGWEDHGDAVLDRISQEHGIIKGSERFLRELRIGDVIGILPVHASLAADLAAVYYTFEGKVIHKRQKV